VTGDPDVLRTRPQLDDDRLLDRSRRLAVALDVAQRLLGEADLGDPAPLDPMCAPTLTAPVASRPRPAGAPLRPVAAVPRPAASPRPVTVDPEVLGRGTRLHLDHLDLGSGR